MPDSSTRSPVPLTLSGIENDARLPALLTSTARAADGAGDVFLPPGYLVPTRSFDVGPAARGAVSGAATLDHEAESDEVVVLELADGGTFVTSAGRLRAALRLARPELVDGDTILLEKLRAESALPSRGVGALLGGVISKVYLLTAGRAPDAIVEAALASVPDQAELGVSWRGTQALMRAIEERLDRQPGLYRWTGAAGKDALLPLARAGPGQAAASDAAPAPMLVFVHGTGSSTLGSFGDLRTDQRGLWSMLQRRFGERIFAFEHRTLSESPIDNAIALAGALPRGARVALVSHSRGGLVCDLLCLGEFDDLIDGYSYPFPGTGAPDPAESQRVRGELDQAHAMQRKQLRELAHLLRERRIVVERYVRCACPANGTLLASANFDLFLSGLLTLIGAVPLFFGSPLYSAFKRVVIDIAKNRTDPHLVPGIEAMLPDSPMARLLRDAPVQPGVAMALIAGDTEGGNMLSRLGVLLSDFLLFDKEDHDLVVNTTSMLAGVAPRSAARVLFDRGPQVSHFRYFSNFETRAALRDWLLADEPARLAAFRALPSPQEYAAALASASRGADSAPFAANRAVVVILPGVMGSNLVVGGADKVWFDLPDLILGGLSKVAWEQREVDAGDLSASLYGQLSEHLAQSHRVELFPYDWRQPLDVLGTRLADFLERLMKQTGAPIRLLAHSMGGLVVRACIAQRRALMDALMARPGARFVMLGTPNHGAHSMVENVLGKGDALRSLARLDLKHDMQQVLDIISAFRGALQLLPRSGFSDTFQGHDEGGMLLDYQRAQTWVELKAKVKDFWFGDQCAGTPSQATLDAAAWLWRAEAAAALPQAYENSSVYVFGQAPNTPCGVREAADGRGGMRLKMVGTSLGDGTVTWDSGRLPGVGSYYFLPAKHGDLPSTAAYFPALAELLNTGATALLGKTAPAARGAAQDAPVSYDAGPPAADDADTLQRALLGGSSATRMPPGSRRRLAVTVQAMDLRFLAKPVMVGHYEQDPIAGAEALIDSELLAGDLSMRYNLGPYAGPRGTATVVLRAHGERLSGAVVTGLGRYEGTLSPSDLTECVCTGALRYLLQVVDVLGKQEREVRLASLLIGYNSSANLSVGASVEALVRGVMEANARFFDSTRLNIRIARLDLVELYMDTAITAVYALRELSARLAAQAGRHGAALLINSELVQGEGIRQRLFDLHQSSYWPRLLVTGAERTDAAGAPVAAVADRLRYLFVSQRARAETVVQQRQPGLAEALVQQQIHDAVWNPDFGRMLFQLMIPHDFKGPARQLDRLVLVLDALTANLPWELMLASEPARRAGGAEGDDDTRPLALRAAVVRQLSSSSYRAQVRASITRHALVIGNPSVRGFAAAFPHLDAPHGQPAPRRTADPIALPGAEQEARSVEALLAAAGYAVEPVIGEGETAQRVLSALYRQPWRFLHVSAHGIYDMRHADGRKRSGVVLSDGLLITAAEIAAMEIVPELVFLNCCHLGQIDTGRNGNKLAASVARELIDIGVRCVIVSGWAVRDQSAMCFGQAFYEQLLVRRLCFGDAVFEARKATWEAWPADITWGAFQAYGDPGWTAEPRADDSAAARMPGQFASLEELLDELARTRVSLSHLRGAIEEGDARRIADNVSALIEQRSPAGWQNLPQLHSALGATWFELNRLETARAEFIAAIGATDQIGVVPIHDIERLASVEVLLGEGRADGTAGAGAAPRGEALIDLALKRLDGLDAVLAAEPGAASLADGGASTVRSALRAGAWKGKASLQAQRLQSGLLREPDAEAARARLHESLGIAIDVYRRAEGLPGSSDFIPTLALKRLALETLESGLDAQGRDAALALARHCRQRSEREFSRRAGMWEAVIRPEAMLVEHLILGSLGQPGDAALAALDEIGRAYADATGSIALKRSEIDAIAGDIDLMARFYDVSAASAPDAAALALTASRLAQLGRRLQAGGARGAA